MCFESPVCDGKRLYGCTRVCVGPPMWLAEGCWESKPVGVLAPPKYLRKLKKKKKDLKLFIWNIALNTEQSSLRWGWEEEAYLVWAFPCHPAAFWACS